MALSTTRNVDITASSWGDNITSLLAIQAPSAQRTAKVPPEATIARMVKIANNYLNRPRMGGDQLCQLHTIEDYPFLVAQKRADMSRFLVIPLKSWPHPGSSGKKIELGVKIDLSSQAVSLVAVSTFKLIFDLEAAQKAAAELPRGRKKLERWAYLSNYEIRRQGTKTQIAIDSDIRDIPQYLPILASGLVQDEDGEETEQILITPLCQGDLLKKMDAEGEKELRRGPFWSLAERVGASREIILAVRGIHNRNIVHLDLKPENLVLPFDGGVKIIDFEFAQDLSKIPLQEVNVTRGTPCYLSPERVCWAKLRIGVPEMDDFPRYRTNFTEIDFKRMDLWALGIILASMNESCLKLNGKNNLINRLDKALGPWINRMLTEKAIHDHIDQYLFPDQGESLTTMYRSLLTYNPDKRTITFENMMDTLDAVGTGPISRPLSTEPPPSSVVVLNATDQPQAACAAAPPGDGTLPPTDGPPDSKDD